MQQCRTVWWNSGIVYWHSLEQCKTVWWNSGTLEQCAGTMEQWKSVEEQCTTE